MNTRCIKVLLSVNSLLLLKLVSSVMFSSSESDFINQMSKTEEVKWWFLQGLSGNSLVITSADSNENFCNPVLRMSAGFNNPQDHINNSHCFFLLLSPEFHIFSTAILQIEIRACPNKSPHF